MTLCAVASRRALRTSSLTCLPVVFLLLLLLLLSVGMTSVDALVMQLLSTDFPYSPASTVQQNAVSNGGARNCVLLELEDSSLSGGLVRFAYSSNVTTTNLRLPLVITVHPADPANSNFALVQSASAVSVTQVYQPVDLERMRQRAAEKRAQLQKETNNNNAVDDEPEGITLAVRPITRTQGPQARYTEGHYAVCFSLDRGSVSNPRPKASTMVERVDIALLDVVTTRAGRGENKAERAGPGGATKNPTLHTSAANEMTDFNDPNEAYAKMIRRIYRAAPEVRVQDLLRWPAVVSSAKAIQLLSEVQAVQQRLMNIMHTTAWMERRYARMRDTAESTFTRIWVSTLGVVTVMCISVWFTFHYTKNIIVKRKLI